MSSPAGSVPAGRIIAVLCSQWIPFLKWVLFHCVYACVHTHLMRAVGWSGCLCRWKSCTHFCLFYNISKLLKCFGTCVITGILYEPFLVFCSWTAYRIMCSYLVVGKVMVYDLELFVDPYNCCTEWCSGLVGSVQCLGVPGPWCRFWYRNHLAWLRFCGFLSQPAGKCHDTQPFQFISHFNCCIFKVYWESH